MKYTAKFEAVFHKHMLAVYNNNPSLLQLTVVILILFVI